MSDANEGLRLVVEFVKRLIDEFDKGYEPIVVWHISSELVKEFDEKVVNPYYFQPSVRTSINRSKAIERLMLAAIEKEKKGKKRNSDGEREANRQ